MVSSVGCAAVARDTTPKGAVEAYAEALRDGEGKAAHALLAPSRQQRVDADTFAQQVETYDAETAEIAQALSEKPLSVHHTAQVVLASGVEVTLVRSGQGRWRIDSPLALYYDQSTPRGALRAFVQALRHRRWDVLLDLMPQQARGDLSAEQLGENMMAQRHQWERMLALLEASLNAPIEQMGNRATMPYGDRFTVRFVKEGDAWKIEDPE